MARTITTRLIRAIPLNHSVNGNPTYRLVTEDGEFRTQSDSSIAYEITNYVGDRVILTMTPAGRVFYAVRLH